MTAIRLPVLHASNGFSRYLQEIRQFPMLEPQEEYTLARNWRENGDIAAAHRLVTSHLRLVYKIAMGYRGYGLSMTDIVAEGNIGLMQAVKRFEPERGFRLATYAMWWIKAAIQEYILRSWSLVKIGSSAVQKRLFFNLRKLKNRIMAVEEGDLTPEHVAQLAHRLDVKAEDVVEMNRRLTFADQSLNRAVYEDGEGEWIDQLAEPAANQETVLAENQEHAIRSSQLAAAMSGLNEREQAIVHARRLQEDPETLEVLSLRYGISKERVRQIEARAMEKLQQRMLPKVVDA